MNSGRYGVDSPDERDRMAESLDDAAESRDLSAGDRDEAAGERDDRAQLRDVASRISGQAEMDRLRGHGTADHTASQEYLAQVRNDRRAAAADRQAAADDRQAAADDRRAAAADRRVTSAAREQAAVERAEQERTPTGQRDRAPGPAWPTVGDQPQGSLDTDSLDTDSLDAATHAETPVQRHGLGLVQRGIELAAAVVRTEESIAETLQKLARGHTDDVGRRRADLAQEAIAGAQMAAEHGERLQRMADQLLEHAQISALRRLLYHAGTALVDLARTEHAIAGAFADLARRTDSAAAAERLRLSREVAAAVEMALQRVADLHRLAEDATTAPPPPSD
ncbi:MAG TPA: hypothetical protein VGJ13_13215 [Pseudonocardiaceae bacterium]